VRPTAGPPIGADGRIGLDERAIAWTKGYRAALDDVAKLGGWRLEHLFHELLADLGQDAAEIEGQARRWLARQKLRDKGRARRGRDA
jgi:hypothetical protein